MKIVTLMADDCMMNPADFDGAWTPHSFLREHRSYKSREEFVPLSIGLRSKLKAGTAFALYYSEHGNCEWRLYGSVDDWNRVDGILIWDHPVSDMGAKTYEERRKDAASFLETYTCWCNGDGYGYKVQEEVTLPCGHKELKDLDLCFGFYGNDLEHMASEVANIVQGDEVQFKGDAAKYLSDSYDFVGKKKETAKV